MSLAVKRKPGFYITAVILPIQFLCLLSLGSFYLPVDDLSGRLSVSLTLVLTVIEYHAQAGQDLPKIGYLTFLDIHLLVSLVFTFLVTAANILSSRYSESKEHVDSWLFFALLCLHGFSWFCIACACQILSTHANSMIEMHEAGHKIRSNDGDDSMSLTHVTVAAGRTLKSHLSTRLSDIY
jgi:hypothetical protein